MIFGLFSCQTSRRHQTAAVECTRLCKGLVFYELRYLALKRCHLVAVDPLTLYQLHNPARLAARPFVGHALVTASCCFCAALRIDSRRDSEASSGCRFFSAGLQRVANSH